MNYPDVKYIVSGYFKPLDATRCCVCGRELRTAESICSGRCFRLMCEIQRRYSESDCELLIESARKSSDSRLIGGGR